MMVLISVNEELEKRECEGGKFRRKRKKEE